MTMACLEKYKNLGRMIQDEASALDPMAYKLTADPYQVERARMTKAYEARDKELREMQKDRTSISRESADEIERDQEF
jgi:hypothetical protein